MKASMLRLLLVTSALLGMSSISMAEGNLRHITVAGSAELRVEPDIATFNFLIQERGKDIPALKQSVDAKINKLLKVIEQLQVADKDVTAVQLRIQPQYDWQNNKQTFLGYSVSREVVVKLRKLEHYAKLLDGAVASGVTQTGDVVMSSSRKDELEREAMQLAVAQAKTKAQLLANSAGVPLGAVYSVEEVSTGPIGDVYMSMSAERGGNFKPGNITIQKTINVVFSL